MNYKKQLLFSTHCCFIFSVLLCLSGCGSLTGIPSHGGGKRFAVEQEMVAATTRATIKKIDLASVRGKNVNLFINAIGDTGSGNLVGGRYSLVSQIRGDYIQSPVTTERSIFPRFTTTTESSSTNAGSPTSATSSTSSILNHPERKQTSEEGSGGEIEVGLQYKGLGAYRNSEEITSDDLHYLSGLLQTYLFLQGVHIVPPSEAEIDVYVTVDVFGTVRTRVEWFIANNEILRAKTALEVMAVDHLDGTLVMPPQAASTEAVYNEQYILWAGPVIITKYLKEADPLLVDFTDLTENNRSINYIDQSGEIAYPFRHQIEKWQAEKKDR